MSPISSFLRRSALLLTVLFVLLVNTLPPLFRLSYWAYQTQSRKSYLDGLLEEFSVFHGLRTKTEEGYTAFQAQAVKEQLEALPGVEMVSFFFYLKTDLISNEPSIFLVEESLLSSGVLEFSGPGFSETGLSESGVPEILLCGKAFQTVNLGDWHEVRLGIRKEKTLVVGKINPPYLLPTGDSGIDPESEGRFAVRLSDTSLLFQPDALIMKDTPQVRERVEKYRSVLPCSAVYIRMNPSATEEQRQAVGNLLEGSGRFYSSQKLTERRTDALKYNEVFYQIVQVAFSLLFMATASLYLAKKNRKELHLRLLAGQSAGQLTGRLFCALSVPVLALLAVILLEQASGTLAILCEPSGLLRLETAETESQAVWLSMYGLCGLGLILNFVICRRTVKAERCRGGQKNET